jgi:hypothetical protein
MIANSWAFTSRPPFTIRETCDLLSPRAAASPFADF